MYLSKPVSGIFEIEKWVTSDGGVSWISEKITAGSSKNNVRPIVPRGHQSGDAGLFWMYGDYKHWTDYSTELKMY